MHDIKPNIKEENEKVPEETVELLNAYKHNFKRSKIFGESAKVRLEKLMVRHSAKKWTAKKKQKMVRRLVTAHKQIEEANNMLDQVNFRLDQLSKTPNEDVSRY